VGRVGVKGLACVFCCTRKKLERFGVSSSPDGDCVSSREGAAGRCQEMSDVVSLLIDGGDDEGKQTTSKRTGSRQTYLL
jgi:hypothetical protein